MQRRGNPKDPGPRNLVLMPVISVRVGRPVKDLGMIGLTVHRELTLWRLEKEKTECDESSRVRILTQITWAKIEKKKTPKFVF